jgi:hypothetical protein
MSIRILLLLPLLLGVSVNGWAARGECQGPQRDRPDTCVELEPPQAIYDVVFTVTAPTPPTADCSGSTVGAKLNVVADRDECMFIIDGYVFCPTQIAVKDSRNAEAQLYFTNAPCDEFPSPSESVYQVTTDAQLEPDLLGNANFKIHLTPNSGLQLLKVHQPGKGDMLTEEISIGDIFYTKR